MQDMNIVNRKYRKRPKGVLTNMYQHMKDRNIKNGFGEIPFSLEEFHNKYLSDKEYLRLFLLWEQNGYQTCDKPSIDRVNNKLGYSFENMRMMPWKKNRIKGDYEAAIRKQKAVDMFDLSGTYIKTFTSMKSAVIETGITQSLISGCCNGKYKRALDRRFSFSSSTAHWLDVCPSCKRLEESK